MALSISPEDLRTLYNDLKSQGYDHQTLVNAAMQNYGVNLDEALGSAGPISYVDKINSGPLQTAAQPSYADYQAYQASSAPAAPVQGGLSTLTPTADVSLTPSGTGSIAPIGSAAYRSAIGQGGIGLDAMNQNILNYLATNPTEAAALAEATKWGVSQEDIERATGKTYEQIFPETFRPGSVLSSGFGNVTEQLGGSGYYKGVAIPTFREIYDTEQGPGKSVAQQLADWKAGIDAQDLTAKAPFGFVETPIYSPGSGDSDAYISGYQAAPATALDYLTKNNPVIANAVYGHTSTDARAYKVVNGQLQEVGQDQITPEDIAQGNAFFMLAGKTGGPNRERMAQLYRADGDNLIPVGDPKMYKGAVEQDMGLAFLDMAASALSFVPGPWQIPAVAYKAIRGAMEGDWTAFAKAFLPPVVATAVNVYEAVESKDPFRIATSLLGSDVMPQVGSFDLGGGITVNDAVKAAKVVDALNNGQYDVAAILAGDLSNTPELTTAGTALRIKNLLDQGQFVAAASTAVNLGRTVDRLKNLTSEQLDIAGLTTAGQESLDAKQDLATRTFTAAKDAGATDAEAAQAADVAVGLVANPRAVIQTDISGTPTGTDEFAGFDNALTYAQALASGALEFEGVEAAQKLQSAFRAGSLDYTNYDLARLEAQLISNQPSLEKAREAAETLYGKGASFNYNGKLYETAKPDSPSVAATQVKGIDTSGATEWERSLMSTPLGFDANNATTARIMSPQEFKAVVGDSKLGIDPKTLDQRYQAYLISQSPRVAAGQRVALPIELAYRPPSDVYEKAPTTFDEFKNTVLGGVAAGSKVASGAQNVINSLVTNLTGAAAGAIAGATSSITGDPANIVSSSLRQLADIATSASDVAVPELAVGAQRINTAVDEARGFDNKVFALGKAALQNPGAAFWWGAKETSEELIPLAIAAKVLRLTGNVGATAAADAFTNFVETQGLTQEQLQRGFEDLGLTPQQAAQASSPGAFAQGAAEGLLSPLWEIPAIKAIAGRMTNEVANLSQTLGSKVGTVTKAGAGETIKEGTEEMAGEAAKQFVMTGGIDPNAVLTAGVIGGPLGGKASSTITAITQTDTALVDNLKTNLSQGQDLSTSVTNVMDTAIKSGQDSQTIVSSLMTGSMDAGQSVGDAASTVIASAVNNNLDLTSTIGTVINTAIKSGADVGIVTADAVSSAVTSTVIQGGNSTAAITSSVGSAVTAANNMGANTVGTINSAVSSAVVSTALVGGDLNTAVASSVSSAVGALATTKGGTDTTIVAGSAVDSAVTSAISQGGNAATIVSSAVTAATDATSKTTGDVTSTAASSVSSAVAAAIATGADSNTVIAAATSAASKSGVDVSVDTSVSGSVTSTVVVSGDTTSTTKVDAATGTKSTVTVSGDTTFTSESNNNGTITTKVNGQSYVVTDTDNTTDITTTTTLTKNTQSTVIVDTTGGIKTEINTDLTTGQTVTVVTDIKTNIQETLPGGGGNDTFVITDQTVPGGVKDDTVPGIKVDTLPPESPPLPPLPPPEPPPVTIDTEVKTATPPTKSTPTKSTQGGGAPAALLATGASGELGRLLGQMLEAKVTDEKFISPLAKLPRLTEEAPMNIDPRLERYLDERGANPESNYYSYGKVPSLDSILGGQVMAAGGEVMPLPFMYARGGLSRQDFRDGKHVEGPGDGQSDDIPAMLADGEFVFPADVVAALGNGSTKAGTEKLYQMMHAIRERARSTKVKDLPPPALKSPLDYLKSRK
jgi:hypothetical protein